MLQWQSLAQNGGELAAGEWVCEQDMYKQASADATHFSAELRWHGDMQTLYMLYGQAKSAADLCRRCHLNVYALLRFCLGCAHLYVSFTHINCLKHCVSML